MTHHSIPDLNQWYSDSSQHPSLPRLGSMVQFLITAFKSWINGSLNLNSIKVLDQWFSDSSQHPWADYYLDVTRPLADGRGLLQRGISPRLVCGIFSALDMIPRWRMPSTLCCYLYKSTLLMPLRHLARRCYFLCKRSSPGSAWNNQAQAQPANARLP